MRRTTQINYPDGGETETVYSDTPGAVWMETKQKIDATRWTDGYDLFDGLGRSVGHSQFNDEGGSTLPWNRVDESYKASGELAFRSYPYFWASPTGAGDNTKPGDTFAYDNYARPTQTTHSDGTTFLTSYTGFATETQDEGNGTGTQRVTKVMQSDGLGRLTSVCEVTSQTDAAGNVPGACGQTIAATGFLTGYGYDALGNLTPVEQGAEARSFSYDGLSRLVDSSNPESGATNYVYDSDGNCPAGWGEAGDLASRTDARGVRTCYAHDALHRETEASYSDGTPTLMLGYDQGSEWGWTLHNTVGRLSSQGSDNGQASEFFDYDAMGRVVHNGRCTPHTCGWGGYDLFYGYDLAGDLLTSNLATQSAGEAAYTYNEAQRITQVASETGGGAEVAQLQNIHYTAAGQELSAVAGSGLPESWSYDGRGRVTGFSFNSGAYGYSVGYASDGDVASSADTANGNWSYGYGPLNRLTSSGCAANASSNCPSGPAAFSYGYDRYGNRWSQTVTAGSGPSPSASFSGGNNRMDGSSYDASGHLLNDGAHSYAYDGEGRLVSVDGGATASYVYGPDGERWAATVNGVTTETVTGQGWNRVVFSTSPGWSATEADLDLNGATPLIYNGTTPYLNLADWLQTARQRATPAGAVTERDLSLPFGDGLAVSGTPESNLHFTGKPRDTESNLDYFGARYYSSRWGRFLTPDWSSDPEPVPYAILADPQSLNLYSYSGNNPVTFADQDGHCYPLCTMAAGAGIGAVVGALAEMGAEYMRGEHISAFKIRNAAIAGAIAGGIIGAAPESAGAALRVGLAIAGNVVGGGTERALNGKKVVDPMAAAGDGASGFIVGFADASTTRVLYAQVIRKATAALIEGIIEAGRRASASPKRSLMSGGSAQSVVFADNPVLSYSPTTPELPPPASTTSPDFDEFRWLDLLQNSQGQGCVTVTAAYGAGSQTCN